MATLESKTQKNDEKFSYWDYIDKSTLIAIILIISFGCLVVGAIYLRLTFPPDGEEPEEPEPHHMGIMPTEGGHEWEYNATHVWRKGEGG